MDKKINWPLLGGVRFFLALVVLTQHLSWYVATTDPVLKLSKFSALVAVLGFLVISGFSVAASYEFKKEGFYFRRGLRIIPVYYASIVLTMIVMIEMPRSGSYTGEIDFFSIIGHLLFLQGIFVEQLSENPVLWTLAIEVFFYIMTPFISQRKAWVLPAVLISAFIFALQRYLSVPYYSQMEFGLNIFFLGWAWLVGFWFFHNRNNPSAEFFLVSIGVVVIVFNGYFSGGFAMITWLLVCISLCYGYLVEGRLMFFSLLGDISYPLYVFHVPVFTTISFLNILSPHYNNGQNMLLMALLFSLFIDQLYDKQIKSIIRNKKVYFQQLTRKNND